MGFSSRRSGGQRTVLLPSSEISIGKVTLIALGSTEIKETSTSGAEIYIGEKLVAEVVNNSGIVFITATIGFVLRSAGRKYTFPNSISLSERCTLTISSTDGIELEIK